MKILIVNLGNILDNIVSTSIVKGIFKKYNDADISWAIKNEEDKYIFKYNTDIKRVISLKELVELDEMFDLLINLNPFFPHQECRNLKTVNYFGFGVNHEFDTFKEVIENDNEAPNVNYFQMLFKLAGLTWRGEGYDLRYYPKSKSKRNRAGLAVAHANLREHVSNEIDLKSMKLWYIPHKKNIFKKLDEINKCKNIITDDLLTFHLAMSLHKYVHFLQSLPLKTKLELFGKGKIYNVQPDLIL